MSRISHPTRVGLLGCGTIAYWAHLRSLQRMPNARLVAAADPDTTAREAAARLAKIPVYQRSDELLARGDIDAVVIAVPTLFHAELAIAAAEARKHFYLEKPIASEADAARRVLAAAEQAGVTAVIGFNRRLHPLHRQARELLLAGGIGRVRAVQTVFCEPTPRDVMPDWKRRRSTGGGVLLDLASHHVDLVRWFLRDEIATVRAAVNSELTEHDSARLQLTMASGIEVQSYFSYSAALADHLEFLGERGTLRVDRFFPSLVLTLPRRFGYGVRRARVAPSAATAGWRLQRWFRPSEDPSHRRSLEAFVQHLQGGPAQNASLVDGMRSLEVILDAEASAGARPAGSQANTGPCASS
jgi:myo-inositol 2-dehydrogenase / D-chiro-inositol 1-dehydrogenase